MRIMLGVPELERLIGGDSEVELELRRGVVENFARQKLASLFDHPEMLRALADLREHAKAEVSARIGTAVQEKQWPHRAKWALTSEVQRTLDEAVERAVKDRVAEALSELETRINDAVERRVAEIRRKALKQVEEAVGSRFKQEVDEAVSRIVSAAYAAASGEGT